MKFVLQAVYAAIVQQILIAKMEKYVAQMQLLAITYV